VLAGLAFTVIAVAIGAAVGLLTGIDLVAVRPEYLLGPLVAGFGLAILGRRWLTHPFGVEVGLDTTLSNRRARVRCVMRPGADR
jgi:hypothetical protein